MLKIVQKYRHYLHYDSFSIISYQSTKINRIQCNKSINFDLLFFKRKRCIKNLSKAIYFRKMYLSIL